MKTLHKKLKSFSYQHIWIRYFLDYGFSTIATIFSAAIFVFGMLVFLEPAVLANEATANITPMVSGGSSGLAQVFKLIRIKIFPGVGSYERIMLSSLYALINVPLLILAFKGVGKRFAIFTLINVGCVFIFTNLFTGDFLVRVALYVNEHGNMITRAFFAGVCTGLSSALAYRIDSSAGGFDIVSFYISARRGTLAGKYGVIINGIIITSFAIVSSINGDAASALGGMLFSFVYLLTVMLIIDFINVRNKKAQIQITTSNKDLPKLLIANIPHGASVSEAKGAFSDSQRFIIYMVVSTTEVKRSVNIIRQLDPQSFVVVYNLSGVYGRFHMKPIK